MSTTYKAVDKALEVPPRPQVVLIAAKVSELMGTAGVNPLHALGADREETAAGRTPYFGVQAGGQCGW